jgi:hypothetical protein
MPYYDVLAATTVPLTVKKASSKVESADMAIAKQGKKKRQQHAKTRVVAASSTTSTPIPASPQVRLTSAHAKFTQTQKGTPEHDMAWEELVDALFVHAK